MSQYSSYLATAPVLQVLKPTSSPESIRQFGNPSQLAKPWFIFRRPSATRYTPRKEAQQLEESHDDSITPVMSFVNPESVLHEDIDCIATTAAEEITAATAPEIILYEQIDTRSSTDVTIFEPPTNQELISKFAESSDVEITAAEVPGTILYEQADTRSSTDIAIFEPYNNRELIKASKSSNADIYYVVAEETTDAEIPEIILYEQINNRSSTDVAIFEPSPHPELTLKVSENSGADIDYVTTATEEITAAEPPETILYEQIDTHSSTDVTILEPSPHPELIFEASESSSAEIDCGVTTAAEEITAEIPEIILYEQIEIRSSTSPELIFKVSESSNANIDYVGTMAADEIAPAEDPEIIQYEQNIRSSTDVTICEPSTSPELIVKVSKSSNEHVDYVVTTTAEDIAAAEAPETTLYEQTDIRSSTNPELISKVSESSNANIDYVVTKAAEEITAAEVPETILYEQIEIRSSTNITIFEPSTIFKVSDGSSQQFSSVPDIAPTKSTRLRRSTKPGPMKPVSIEKTSDAPFSKLLPPIRSITNPPGRAIPAQVAATANSYRPRSPANALRFPPKGPHYDRQRPAIAADKSARSPNVRVLVHPPNSGSQRYSGKPSPTTKLTPPKKFGSSRFAGSVLHLPTADEDEAQRRHALINGKLMRAPKVGISVRQPSLGLKRIAGKGHKVQERVGSNAAPAVMTVVEEEEEEVAECNPIPAVEKVEEQVAEKMAEEETGAVISDPGYIAPRGVEISGAWPLSRSRNVRRKPIVWRKLDNIPEAECEEDEPPVPEVSPAKGEPVAVTIKDLEEVPIVDGEEEGGVSVETPSPEERVEEEVVEEDSGTGVDPAGEGPSHTIPYPVPARWSSRIGEMRVTRRPSYNWETACSSDAIRFEPMFVERVRYPAPMRWSSRIGEVKRARTLGYAGLPPPAENPEPEVLDAPEGVVPTLRGGGAERGLPVLSGLTEEAVIVPQEEEQSSDSGESRESQGAGAEVKKTGSLRRRAQQAWKKIGRVFSGGRG